jgi:hypothetical protein
MVLALEVKRTDVDLTTHSYTMPSLGKDETLGLLLFRLLVVMVYGGREGQLQLSDSYFSGNEIKIGRDKIYI